MKSLEQIREVIGNLSDVLNKARLFDKQVKAKDQSTQKIFTILMDFGPKMEIILGEMRKLFSESPAKGLSRPLLQIATP